MFLISSVSRSMKMLDRREKAKNSRDYLKEVKKSTGTLFKEVREETSGSSYVNARDMIKGMRQASIEQNRGFYRTQLKKAINNNFVIHSVKEYAGAVKSAFSTGKLYKSQTDMLSNIYSPSERPDIEQDYLQAPDVTSTAIYDTTRANIDMMRAGTSAQLQASQVQTGELKQGFTRMSTGLSVGFGSLSTPLNSISSFLSNEFKAKLDTHIDISRQHLAVATEMRDLMKKSMSQDLTIAKATMEKDKTFMDLLMEGNVKGALGKGAENILKDVDKWGIFTRMLPGLASYLQMIKENPLEFVKDSIMGTKMMKSVKNTVDPRLLAQRGIYRMMGSNRGINSTIGKALHGNQQAKADGYLDTTYEKGSIAWNGIAQKSLTTVIPTYLRKILATLNGQSELVYNYKDGKFTTHDEMKTKMRDTVQKNFMYSTEIGYELVQATKAQGKNFPPIMSIAKQWILDLAYGGFYDPEVCIEWNYKRFVQLTGSNINEESYAILKQTVYYLLADKGKQGKSFKKLLEYSALEMKMYNEQVSGAMGALNGDAGLTGMESLFNGADKVINTGLFGGNSSAGNDIREQIRAQKDQQEREMTEMFKKKEFVKNDDTNAKDYLQQYLSAEDVKRFVDRVGHLNAEDMKTLKWKKNSTEFIKWCDAKYEKMTPEMKEKISNAFQNERWNDLRSGILGLKVDVDAYVNEYAFEHLANFTELSTAEKKKQDTLKDIMAKQKGVNSVYDGYERAFGQVEKDEDSKNKMSDIVRKAVLAGGAMGIAGMSGMVPLVGAAGGVMAPILAGSIGVGLTIFANRKKLADLINPHLTDEEKQERDKLKNKLWSKIATSFGMAGIAGLGVKGAALLFPALGPAAPFAMAAAGIGAWMFSEKDGFKKFFFGDQANKEKTFYQLTKEKLLGTGNGDDGVFGKWINPMLEKSKGLFEKADNFMKDKVLDPLVKTMGNWVDKLDKSKFGEKFKEAMGYSLKEFGSQMKENVWKPLTGNLLKGIGKLFKWGRKKLDNGQAEEREDFAISDAMRDVYRDKHGETGADGKESSADVKKRQKRDGIIDRLAEKKGIDREQAEDLFNRRYGRIYGNAGGSGTSGGAASDIKNKYQTQRAMFETDKEKFMAQKKAKAVVQEAPGSMPAYDKLVGKGKSEVKNAYYNQYDDEFKDEPFGMFGTIKDNGCAVMVGGMVLSRLKNEKFDLERLRSLALRHRDLLGINVDYTYFPALAKANKLEYGVRQRGEMYTVSEMNNIFKKKSVIVALIKQKGMSNHYILLKGIVGDFVTYDDPARERSMTIPYNTLIDSTNVMIMMSKTTGIFGLIGKFVKGVINKFSGEAKKVAIAKKWGVDKEFVDRMTKEEWNKYKKEKGIPKELLATLRGRRTQIKGKDGKVIMHEDLNGKKTYKANHALNKYMEEQSGGGASTHLPSKNRWKGLSLSNLQKIKLRTVKPEFIQQYQLAAQMNHTSVMGQFLSAIYAKLSDISEDIQDGTDGVPYNVEAIKRAFFLKNFPGLKEETVTGSMEQSTRGKFTGNRKGKLRGTWNKFKAAVTGKVRDVILDPVGAFKGKVAEKWRKLKEETFLRYFTKDFWGKEWQKFKDAQKEGWERIKNRFEAIKEGIVGTIKGVLGGAKEILLGIGETIGAGFTAVGKIAEGIGNSVANVTNAIIETGQIMVNGFVNSLEKVGGMIGKAVTGSIALLGESIAYTYTGIKTLVKDTITGTAKVLGWVGRGALAGADWLMTGVSSKYRKAKESINEAIIRNVRVVGGHIDTVGVIGAIDRDSYVSSVKRFRKVTKGSVKEQDGSRYSTGLDTLRSNSVNNRLDFEQDVDFSFKERMVKALEKMKGGTNSSSTSDSEKTSDTKTELSTMEKFMMGAGAIALTAAMLKDAMVGALKEFFTSKNIKLPDFKNPADIAEWLSTEGNLNLNQIPRLLKNGKNLVKGAWKMKGDLWDMAKGTGKGLKNGIGNAFKKKTFIGRAVEGFKSAKGAWTDSWLDRKMSKFGFTPDEIAEFRKGKLLQQGDNIFEAAEGGYKMANLGDDAAKSGDDVVKYIKQAKYWKVKEKALAHAEKMKKVTAMKETGMKWLNKSLDTMKGKGKEILEKSKVLLEKALKAVCDSTAFKFIVEKTEKGLAGKITNGLKKFVGGLAEAGAARGGAKKLMSTLGKFVPLLNIAFAVSDFLEGWTNADRYLDVPDTKLTPKMKIVAAITRTIQGLITVIPYFLFLIVVPTELLVKLVWSLVGTDSESASLKAEQDKYKVLYEQYKNQAAANGQTPLAYDDWIDKQSMNTVNKMFSSFWDNIKDGLGIGKTKEQTQQDIKTKNEELKGNYQNGTQGVPTTTKKTTYPVGSKKYNGVIYKPSISGTGNPVYDSKGNQMYDPIGGGKSIILPSTATAVKGPGSVNASGMPTSIPGLGGNGLTLYSQNYNVKMSVGGDGKTVAEVGCGPVSVNLFLQKSGYKESLSRTISGLKDKRKPGEGFSGPVLTSYIDSKGIGAKHVTSLPKEDIIKKGYAILLVKKKSKMNTLNENHAMFVMSARYDGVMVYDPSRTTQAFYSWIDVIKCCYGFIIATGNNSKTVKAGIMSSLNQPMSDIGKKIGSKLTTAGTYINDLNKRLLNSVPSKAVQEVAQVPREVIIQPTKSTNDNINIENKLDTLIMLMSKLVEVVSTPAKPGTVNPLQVLMNGLTNSMNSQQGGGSSNNAVSNASDAWMNSRMSIIKGGK